MGARLDFDAILQQTYFALQHRKSRTDIRKFPLFLDGVVSVVESERRIPG
jgi:hypothetical protein